MSCVRLCPNTFSLSYIKKGKKRNYCYPPCSPFAYLDYCYTYNYIVREKMLPCYPCFKRTTVTERDNLTLRPRCCLQCSESLAGLQVGRSTEQGDHDQLKELYSFDSNTGVCGGENRCGLCVCELPQC
uniref:Ornithine decarboxylase antizyme 3 n=1 Tax=Monodelphis domestica TaxID=13616 RepID=A0A5F8HIR8_MONDO